MSGTFPFDDEAWDEERWEAFLRDHDKRVDHYMEVIFRFMRKHPMPDPEDEAAFATWRASLRAWMRDEGWRCDDLILPFFWFAEEHLEEDLDDVFPFGGATSFIDPEDENLDALQHLPVYQGACDLSVEVLDWAYALSGDDKDSRLVHFCAHVAQIPAHVARGYGIGHERDTLGGNIACVKRGLSDANAALDLLARMKPALYMDPATYRRLYEQAYEVRNALALYLQDLRDRFDLGVD